MWPLAAKALHFVAAASFSVKIVVSLQLLSFSTRSERSLSEFEYLPFIVVWTSATVTDLDDCFYPSIHSKRGVWKDVNSGVHCAKE